VKAKITITDDNGNVFEGEANLTFQQGNRARQSVPSRKKARSNDMDFSAPLQYFMKTNGNGFSGPKKFTLLLARMSNGSTERSKVVEANQIEKTWNKMTRIMGMPYNAAYASRARDNGWIDSPKAGKFHLTTRWREILLNSEN